MTKLKINDIISIFLCATAAVLCACGSQVAPYAFICSSTYGIKESYKQKAACGLAINIIFLLLNLYSAITVII